MNLKQSRNISSHNTCLEEGKEQFIANIMELVISFTIILQRCDYDDLY